VSRLDYEQSSSVRTKIHVTLEEFLIASLKGLLKTGGTDGHFHHCSPRPLDV
jgi:hypothetical protein